MLLSQELLYQCKTMSNGKKSETLDFSFSTIIPYISRFHNWHWSQCEKKKGKILHPNRNKLKCSLVLHVLCPSCDAWTAKHACTSVLLISVIQLLSLKLCAHHYLNNDLFKSLPFQSYYYNPADWIFWYYLAQVSWDTISRSGSANSIFRVHFLHESLHFASLYL